MIGIYGGTFDPVHHGHLRTAFEVYEALKLSELRFMPCGDEPAHRGRPLATAQQRLAMLELAIGTHLSAYPFRVDARELHRNGPSYMIDSLQSLRVEQGGERPLCLILGQDAFLGLSGWHRWEELLDYAHIGVMTRPNVALQMKEQFSGRILSSRTESYDILHCLPAGRVCFVPVTQLDISASRIRELVEAERSICFLSPKTVLDYIERDRLYRAG